MSDNIRTFKNKETGEVRTFKRKESTTTESSSSASKAANQSLGEKARISAGIPEGGLVREFLKFSEKAAGGAREYIRSRGTVAGGGPDEGRADAYMRGFNNPSGSPTATQNMSQAMNTVPMDSNTSSDPNSLSTNLSAAKNTAISIAKLAPMTMSMAQDVITNPSQAIGAAILEGIPGAIASANPRIAKAITDYATKQNLKAVASDVLEGMGGMAKRIKQSFSPKLGPGFPKVSQIKDAEDLVNANLASLKSTNIQKSKELALQIDSAEIPNRIKYESKVSSLANKQSKVAYEQSKLIHGDPVESNLGNPGLGLKASKKLNKEYWKEVQPLHGKEMYVEDAREGLKTTLQQEGALDFQGNPVPNVELGPDHSKLLNLYNSLDEKKVPGVIDALGDVRKITVGELKSKIEDALGKGSGGRTLARDAFSEAARYVDEITKINASYVEKYQTRNGIFDKFNIFTKMGYRRGAVDLNKGASLLKNLASENPADINLDNKVMMKFLEDYAGVDPSRPVVGIGNEMKNVKGAYKASNDSDKLRQIKLREDILASESEATIDALQAQNSFSKLKAVAIDKEAKAAAKTAFKNDVKKTAVKAAVGTGVAGTITGLGVAGYKAFIE